MRKASHQIPLTLSKRICTLLCLICFLAQGNFAQELVPNGSFEEVINCPETVANLEEDCAEWYNSIFDEQSDENQTPDYFHTCSPELLLRPPNVAFGFQNPREGSAYVGLVTYHANVPGYREIIGIELSEPLNIGDTYLVNLSMSPAFSTGNTLASQGVGFKFSHEATYNESSELVNNSSDFLIDSIVSDTTNWLDVSVLFNADSAYRFLHIGNFYDDSQTEVFNLGGIGIVSYYFLDHVSVSSTNTTNNSKLRDILNLFPNPSTDFVNIELVNETVLQILVFNSLGELVLTTTGSNSNKQTISLKSLRNGIYHLKIFTNKSVKYAPIIKI